MSRLDRRLQWLELVSRRYSRVRAGIVLTGILTALIMSRVVSEGVTWMAIGAFVAGFIGVASYHNRVKDSIKRHTIWRYLKGTHVARMTLDWSHIPSSPAAPPEADHPFETDLNLTGERSLHQLLDATITAAGSARLRTWLLHPLTDPVQVRDRQDIVRELVPLTTFRDRLTLNGALVAWEPHARWDSETLRHWLERPFVQSSLIPWLAMLGLLAGANILLGFLHALSLAPALWIVSLTVYIVLYHIKHRDLSALFTEAFHLEKTLNHFRAVLLYLEDRGYGCTPHLARLCRPFWQADIRPSTSLRKIARIAGAASIQQGNIVGPLVNLILPWDLYFAHRFTQYKEEVRTSLPMWLETWHELEALNALAHFGYLNPDCAFPEVRSITDDNRQPVFRAHHLGHPLLPDDVRVCNDVVMARLGEMVMVTGSNMSGKSTFLRTLGVNLCLAFSGGPVMASSLHTLPFRLYTCITVNDSVTDGISYFYAEVRRLKALLQALRERHAFPLFFLIDEIFRGTNNRERLIGSRAYIQALIGAQGVGVVSTHDLELIKLADEVNGIHNAHFREEVVHGHMVFDYKLRPGPCPTTNALTIMRMEGLPVAPECDTLPPP